MEALGSTEGAEGAVRRRGAGRAEGEEVGWNEGRGASGGGLKWEGRRRGYGDRLVGGRLQECVVKYE